MTEHGMGGTESGSGRTARGVTPVREGTNLGSFLHCPTGTRASPRGTPTRPVGPPSPASRASKSFSVT